MDLKVQYDFTNAGYTITKTIHSRTYGAISPIKPELSQAGKIVLITGGATGIGYAISRAFAQADASTIIISSRRPTIVANAAAKLMTEFGGKGLKALGLPCDVGNSANVDALWDGLEKSGIVVDVLVLNAAVPADPIPILEYDIEKSWAEFRTNIRGPIHFTQKFYNQKGRSRSKKLFLINVATNGIHDFVISKQIPHYSLTKIAGTFAIQQIAKDISADDMHVLSYHPGVVWTPMTQVFGKDALEWDSEDLAGNFAVWAASDEAKSLHGRFVWCKWDVEEMKSATFQQRLTNEPNFLKIGVHGLQMWTRSEQSDFSQPILPIWHTNFSS